MTTEYQDSPFPSSLDQNNTVVELREPCDITGKLEVRKFTLPEVHKFLDNKRKKEEQRQHLVSALDVLSADPSSSPDFVFYFRGKYVIYNNVGHSMAVRILRAVGTLLPNAGFPVPLRKIRSKKAPNDGKRESSTPEVLKDGP